MVNGIAPFPEGTDEDIVGYIGPEVPDLGIVVHRGAAAVKTRLSGYKGDKFFQGTSQRIV
jgi:hypothetical protein